MKDIMEMQKNVYDDTCKYVTLMRFYSLTFQVKILVMISHYRGHTPNQSRYRRMMLVGYLIPTIIVIMAIVTDKVAPECATLKPGIGDNSCFFAGNIDCISIVCKSTLCPI